MTRPVARAAQTGRGRNTSPQGSMAVAHDLLIEHGEAAMCYVGDPPWHTPGQGLNQPATAAEAIKAARLVRLC